MIRFQFNQFKGTITQALIFIKSVQIDDFWTLDMSISTLDMSVSTLDMLLSTLDSRQLPRLHIRLSTITQTPQIIRLGEFNDSPLTQETSGD